jgi:dolichol-phosphate mannosyltransferase
MFSIISPVYKSEKILPFLIERIEKSMAYVSDDYEIILVEDCGPDNSWEVIEALAKNNPKIVGVKLSRNFGQHHAITCGLEMAKGEWIIVMDCDLQDQPEEIPKLFKKAQEGFDIVLAQRFQRSDGYFKKLVSKLFHWFFSYLAGVPQDGSIANFGIYHRKVINEVVKMKEPLRAFRFMVKWVGFNSIAIPVEHASRFEGSSSYNWKKLINLALDIAISYSDRPLKFAIKMGACLSVLSLIFAVYNIVNYLLGNILVSGFTSLIVSIWFLSGLIIFFLGIIGLYLEKTFEGVKSRPLFIVQKMVQHK